MKKTSAHKQVKIVARYQLKANGHVIYKVRSARDASVTYCTTLVNGKASGCTCPARKPCYHMIELEKIEAARDPQPATSSDQQQREPVSSLATTTRERVETSSLYRRPFSLMR